MRPHYYDWERPKPGREHAHPFEQERELYLRSRPGLLTLHRPSPADVEGMEVRVFVLIFFLVIIHLFKHTYL